MRVIVLRDGHMYMEGDGGRVKVDGEDIWAIGKLLASFTIWEIASLVFIRRLAERRAING